MRTKFNIKPIYLLIGGSVLVFLLTFGFTIIVNLLIQELPFWVVIGLPLLTSLLAFTVFYFFINYFINDRLKILYKSIRKGKMTSENRLEFKLTDDVIGIAEKETALWTEEKNTEISKLKVQEEFRREFLGNLAHELKTPAFAIQGYLLTLLDGGLEDENVNRRFLERAEKSTERLVNLIEDLDQITKLEVESLDLDIRSFDIKELTQEIFETLEQIALEKNVTLKFSKDYGPIYVMADKMKIGQVLTNLITNSIFYGNVGGTTTIRFDEMDQIVTTEIADDGLGIEEVHFPRLFERFYRVEKSRNRNEGGSGLGLAIVKHIIESHGQTISVRSTIGLGSTFAFSLDKSAVQSNVLYSSKGLQVNN